MPTTLDCRGLACPGPVLRCKECIESDAPDTLAVTVDNEAARENVSRFLTMRGYAVAVAEAGGGVFTLTATAGAAPVATPNESLSAKAETGSRTVVFITADVIGRGDDTLGAKLMVNFVGTLPELGERLWRIVLVNGGVRLAVAGSPVIDKLKALEQAGVSILVCGTCLDFYGILDKKEVGQTTNMLDVVTSLDLADKIVQI
ncbi:sulfurtransferase-like selenium metabolism protein YedF [Solidesulfovibrio carbinolicus]|uniref:Sulfurtransferase-like selenium metabolism protein YedF n=1 Tax=Solidesulfovibrio carbinolicus TaxID=296842 RepID=A0A4P6HLA8_9BACT|nr:sulfurtransferase-like selenium metabolism protein YedF [Solidesulfovibrio carbinolicus]QAZ67765.1 sulfurtransferase-like selenium metabolism protein YedF [Solidesulfovibrio carbinolicus]